MLSPVGILIVDRDGVSLRLVLVVDPRAAVLVHVYRKRQYGSRAAPDEWQLRWYPCWLKKAPGGAHSRSGPVIERLRYPAQPLRQQRIGLRSGARLADPRASTGTPCTLAPRSESLEFWVVVPCSVSYRVESGLA